MASLAARRLLRRVALVETLEIIRQPFVCGLDEFFQRRFKSEVQQSSIDGMAE
jgi:hypothetical protein